MILVWRGAGILVAIIAVASLFTGDYVAETVLGGNVSNRARTLTIFWMSALLTLPLALLLRRPAEPFQGKPTDPEAFRYEPHDLFFVPVVWWPLIFFVLGIASYFGMSSNARL